MTAESADESESETADRGRLSLEIQRNYSSGLAGFVDGCVCRVAGVSEEAELQHSGAHCYYSSALEGIADAAGWTLVAAGLELHSVAPPETR